jgi:2-C-methyl-D-erythritol 4-phosphate cytidylyltransferase
MGGVDKIFAPVLGRPLLSFALDQLQAFLAVTEIVLVLDPGSLNQGRELVDAGGYPKVAHVCSGGKRRQDSVRAGLDALTPCDWVIVHDGARPCLDVAMLERGLAAVQEAGAVVAGVPVKDTIKIVSDQGAVVDTPDRKSLWAAQTPQIFRYDLLRDAHDQCGDDVTDDAMMVESLGHVVKMFLGSYENLKVTTPEDLILAEAFLKQREPVG